MADRAIHVSSHRDGKIDPEELGNVFQLLRHKTKKVSGFLEKTKSPSLTAFSFPPFQVQSDIEDMIWEVDDDCDKCVNWPESQAMYHRCRNDKTGGFDGDFNTSKCQSETNNFSFSDNFQLFCRIRASSSV